MNALMSKGMLYISAKDCSEIEQVKEVVSVLVDNMGYQIVDGQDARDEYYDGLAHTGTISEARDDFRLAILKEEKRELMAEIIKLVEEG